MQKIPRMQKVRKLQIEKDTKNAIYAKKQSLQKNLKSTKNAGSAKMQKMQ